MPHLPSSSRRARIAMVGLVIGKSLGTGLASWPAVKTGLAALPERLTWRHLIGTAFLAGIGFTMALFISGLAFAGTHFEREAQLAILLGSLVAAAVGIAILLTTKPAPAQRAESSRVPAMRASTHRLVQTDSRSSARWDLAGEGSCLWLPRGATRERSIKSELQICPLPPSQQGSSHE